MKRFRSRHLAILVVLALIISMGFPAIRFRVLGVLNREAFFEGRPTSYWVRGITKESNWFGDDGPRGDVGKMLREGGAAAVPVLSEMLRHERRQVRVNALLALSVMNPTPPEAIPELVAFLQRGGGPNDIERAGPNDFQLATVALTRASPVAAANTLAEILRNHSQEAVRLQAIHQLTNFFTTQPGTLPALREAMDDPHELVRLRAAQAVWRKTGRADDVLPVLRELLQHDFPEEQSLRREVASLWSDVFSILSQMGPEAQPALPELQKIAALPVDPRAPILNQYPQLGALRTMVDIRIPPAEVVPLVLAFYEKADAEGRPRAAELLGRIGPPARPAVPVLLHALQKPREPAYWAGCIAQAGNAAGTPLADVGVWSVVACGLFDQERMLRHAAVQALLKIDPRAAAAAGIDGRVFLSPPERVTSRSNDVGGPRLIPLPSPASTPDDPIIPTARFLAPAVPTQPTVSPKTRAGRQ